MSIEAWAAVRALTKRGVALDPRDRFVLYALADYANDQHEAWPSLRTLSDFTGYDRRTVIRALGTLEDAGLIESETRKRDNGSQTSNRYHLAVVTTAGGCQAVTPPVSGSHPPRGTLTPPPVSGSHPQTYQKDLPTEPPVEQHTLAVASRPQPATDLSVFMDVWNTERGPLPAIAALGAARQKALRRLVKEHGDASLDLFRDAVRVVAHDTFWAERRYGFDSLLRDGRVQEKAERAAEGFITPGDARLATTASSIADSIGGLT